MRKPKRKTRIATGEKQRLTTLENPPPTDAPERRDQAAIGRRRRRPTPVNIKLSVPAIVLIAALAVASYVNTLPGGFVYDDTPIIVENPLIRSLSNIPQIFNSNYWEHAPDYPDHTLYRPLTVTTYALNYAIGGYHPRGYHVVNVVLHAAVCVVMALFITACFGDTVLALVAAAIFAVHPVHAEAVANVIGRAELLCLLGILTTLFGYFKSSDATERGRPAAARLWSVLSAFAYMAAMLSKEIGIIAPGLIVILEGLLPDKRQLLKRNIRALSTFAVYVVAAILFLIMRAQAVGDLSIITGFTDLPVHQRIFTATRILGEYLLLLIYPVTLSADYWLDAVPIARSIFEPAVMLSVASLLFLLILAIGLREKHPACTYGIAFFALAVFPVSNIAFPIGVMKAERILYSPSAGFILALVALIRPLLKAGRWRPIAVAIVACAVALMFIRTCVRNGDWKSDYHLAAATLDVFPNNPEFNKILGFHHQNNGDFVAARAYLLRSHSIKPFWNVLYNLGNIEMETGNEAQAVDYFNQALQLSPGNIDVLNNLAIALMRTNRISAAANILESIIIDNPRHPGAYINLLPMYASINDREKAVRIMVAALQRFPDNPQVQQNAEMVRRKFGVK